MVGGREFLDGSNCSHSKKIAHLSLILANRCFFCHFFRITSFSSSCSISLWRTYSDIFSAQTESSSIAPGGFFSSGLPCLEQLVGRRRGTRIHEEAWTSTNAYNESMEVCVDNNLVFESAKKACHGRTLNSTSISNNSSFKVFRACADPP